MRPFPSRSSSGPATRVNGKIRAREVRVIGPNDQQLGIFPLHEAINMARSRGMDLVEISATATPPVCRIVDFGKYRYEQAKRDKESHKNKHANKVKEIQISPSIDPHDFGVKLNHAREFLSESMKVKVTLRFRGREMAHKEVGFQQVENFIRELAAYGQPDAPPKLIGKGLNVMISPLAKNKRARLPQSGDGQSGGNAAPSAHPAPKSPPSPGASAPNDSGPKFANNPFAGLELKPGALADPPPPGEPAAEG
jgi:translation initiation factor IF-3